jgi:hypothetical protein
MNVHEKTRSLKIIAEIASSKFSARFSALSRAYPPPSLAPPHADAWPCGRIPAPSTSKRRLRGLLDQRIAVSPPPGNQAASSPCTRRRYARRRTYPGRKRLRRQSHFHGKPLPVSHPTPSARSFAEAGIPAGSFPDNGARADAVAPVSQQRGMESGIHSETGPARRQRRPETSHFCATAGGKEGRREVRGCAKTVPAAPWRRFSRQASWPSESIP